MARATDVVSISLLPEDKERLDLLAQTLGLKRSEVARDAIVWMEALHKAGVLIRANQLGRLLGSPPSEALAPILVKFVDALDGKA